MWSVLRKAKQPQGQSGSTLTNWWFGSFLPSKIRKELWKHNYSWGSRCLPRTLEFYGVSYGQKGLGSPFYFPKAVCDLGQ